MLEELTSLHELHDEIDPGWRVEAVLKPNQERVANLLEDLLLRLDLLNLVLLDHITLVHNLDSVEFLVILLLGEDDLSEGSSTQDSDDIKIVLGKLLSIRGDDGLRVLGLLHLLLASFGVVVLELLRGHGLGHLGTYHRVSRRETCGVHVFSLGPFSQFDLNLEPELHLFVHDDLTDPDKVVEELVSPRSHSGTYISEDLRR